MLGKIMVVLALAAPCAAPTPEPEPVVRSACFYACKRMNELKCAGWDGHPGEDGRLGTADDVNCQDLCEYRERLAKDEGNPALSLSPECVAKVLTCEDADSCGQ